MIDLRYLALTLIGVFLALAIGLMTGSALGSPDKRDAAYESLRGQFELLRLENQRVQQENDDVRRGLNAREQALRRLLPAAVRGRLAGSTVTVVICGRGDDSGTWSGVEAALRESGAQVGPVLRVPDQVRELSAEDRLRFGRAWDPQTVYADRDAFEAVRWLVRGLARGGPTEQVTELARLSGIELRNPTEAPTRRVLLLTAARDELRANAARSGELPELRIVDATRAEGVRLVAAEPEEVELSVVDLLGRRGVTTVDHADTAAGQISVVLALAGQDGRFGTKPGAGSALPPLESP